MALANGTRLVGATVRADGGRITIGAPAVLFDVDAAALGGGFDVTPDGKKFFMRRRARRSRGAPDRASC